MSIGKKIRLALLGLAILVTLLLCVISIYGFLDIKRTFQATNKTSIDNLYEKNVAEITGSSVKLAVSLSNYYAQTINIDFKRIMGELDTLKGSLEALYNGRGVVKAVKISRYQEYIISQAAVITDKTVAETLAKLSAATPMFDNVLRIEPNISLAYLVLENGMVISSTDTFYPKVEKADMRTRDWYRDTVTANRLHWSELYTGTDGRSYITCSVPVKDQQQRLFGVLAFDIRVSEISEKILNTKDASFVSAFIMSKTGSVLLASDGIAETGKRPYYRKLQQSIASKRLDSGYYTDDKSIIGYARISATGWILATVLDYHLMMAPVQSVARSVSDTGKLMGRVITDKTRTTLVIFAVVIVVVLLLVSGFSSMLTKSIIRPVNVLAEGARVIGSGNLDYEIEELGADEIGMLAATFNSMTVRIKEYIGQVAQAAAEKQRLESELDVARNIQLGMLPQQIDCPGYEISGMMLPAKEVGGDFYDFFLVGEDRLCFVVADVSGKGVGAALFMTVAKMVIKTAAQRDASVETLLEIANNLLCAENPAGLFVTAYVGLMNIATGEIAYSCAGHNPPIMLRSVGVAEFIPVKHRLPLAAMENIKYPVLRAGLGPGETIILYTDGVTEATNQEEQLFGDERLLAAAQKLQGRDAGKIVAGIKLAVDEFVRAAPQFDDITIVAIHRKDERGV
jgi:sigma-B regulation protein RsbU (phosphoserine phosphatase)